MNHSRSAASAVPGPDASSPLPGPHLPVWPIGSAIPSTAETGPARLADAPFRGRGFYGTRHLLVFALALMALLPLLGMGIWMHRHASDNAVRVALARDTLVARDLAIEMSDHLDHARAAFAAELALAPPAADAPAGPALADGAALAALRAGLDIRGVCLLAPPDAAPAPGPCALPPGQRAALRAAAAPPGARPALRAAATPAHATPAHATPAHATPAHATPAHATAPDGSEVFRLLATLPDGRVAMAVLGVGHMRWLARPAFAHDGALLALIDGQGALLLTPFQTAQAPGLGAVLAAAKDRPLGFDRAAAAAFARVAVPDTGWQVVVAERIVAPPLLSRTSVTAPVAMGAFALLAAMALAALLGRMLVRPLGKIAATARAVLAGDEAASVPALSAAVPRELRLLGRAMNMMLAMLRRRAAETEAALAEARAASAAKSVFLATMSHEIRTPLHGMLGSLELLDAGALEPGQRRYLEGAGQAGRRLARLVDAVFDMAQLEAGRLVLAHAPFRLAGLIGSLEQEMAPQAAARGLRFTTHLPAHLDIALAGDAARLRQILANLLDNAVKFTDAGGVTLGVTSLAETAHGINLRFAVADTGIGIGRDRQERLFTPFAPGDASLSRRQDGAGLGLAIAHALAQRMGGALGVDSSSGGGSVFWLMLSLPRAVLAAVGGSQAGCGQAGGAGQGAAPADANAKADAPRAGARVLLVEDNAANRRIALAMLETLGCRVTMAEDGHAAVAAWKQGQFDLVFMDCQMPGMDGLAATRDIRRLEVLADRPRTPILALTANAEDESRDACLEAGMDAVLTKPLTLAGLRAALAAWCMPSAAQEMR